MALGHSDDLQAFGNSPRVAPEGVVGATSPAITGASFTMPFTNRAHEIAVLVMQGLSNRDVAAAVSLSIRTVEGYIYSACNKVGVTGRAELAGLMRSVGR